MKNLVSYFACLLLIGVSDISAQQFEWVVPPIFKGYDDIIVDENIPLKFIVVKKRDKVGVVSLKDELIVPVEYSKIFVREEYVQAFMGQQAFFFDEEGYEYDVEREIKQPKEKKKEREILDKIHLVESGIKKLWPGTQVVSNRKHRFDIILPDGDTLLSDYYLKNANVVSNTYFHYFDQKDRDYVMLDQNKKQILRQKKISLRQLENGSTIVAGKFLVDSNGKKHFEDTEGIELVYGTTFLKVKVNGKHLVYTPDLDQIFPEPYDYITALQDDDISLLVATKEKESSIYDINTNEVKHVPFWLGNIRTSPKYYRNFKKDSLIGIYDLRTMEVIVEPKFKYVEPLGEKYFICADDKYNRIKNNKTYPNVIYDIAGNEVYSSIGIGATHLGMNYFHFHQSDSTSVILNENMDEVLEVSYNMRRMRFPTNWVSAQEEGGSKMLFYPISNYFNNDRSVVSEIRPEFVKAKGDFVAYYIIKNKDGIGFCDTKGKLLYPTELTEIGKVRGYGSDYNGCFKAKKNGKWGVMKRASN